MKKKKDQACVQEAVCAGKAGARGGTARQGKGRRGERAEETSVESGEQERGEAARKSGLRRSSQVSLRRFSVWDQFSLKI